MNLLKLVAVMVSVSAASAALAGPRITHFENRQTHQQARTQAGIESGRIGPREANFLQYQQASTDRALGRRAADGSLDRRDGLALDRRYDKGSSAIPVANHWPR